MAWVDLPTVPDSFKRRTGFCEEAARLGMVPSWPSKMFRPIPVPGPPMSPDDTSVELLAKHLASLYRQAYEWGGKKANSKAKFHMALHVLSADNYEVTRRVKSALRTLRDGSSKLPLVVWAWWCVQRGYDKGFDGASPQAVFEPDRLTDSKVRSFFWRDCGQGLMNLPSLWPIAAQKAHVLYQEFLTFDAFISEPAVAANIWEVWYAREFQRLADKAATQYGMVNDKVLQRVYAYDLGLWLTTNVPEYLKMSNVALIGLK